MIILVAATGKQGEQSKAIGVLAYNTDTRLLRIRFRSGHTWGYPNVSRQMFTSFRHAESKGGFYNRNFKPRFGGKGRRLYGAAALAA